jgi:HAD superfamily hydrolase (TIGR01509 family)
MPAYSAFIFDMNGTMIDDMHYHELAWHNILTGQLNAGLSREEVKHHMYGKNEELFERVFGQGRFSQQEVGAIALQKEARYREEFLPHLKLIKGLDDLLTKAKANHIPMAIGTAAIPENVDFVLDNLNLRSYFPVIITAGDVQVSKPHPDVFLKAAERLAIAPEHCIVFEDSPKGIEAARRAGMKAVGITSYHTADELMSDNVLCIVNDYSDPVLNEWIW